MKLPIFSNPVLAMLLLTSAFTLAGENNGQEKHSVEEEIVVIERNNSVNIPRSFGSSRIDGWRVLDGKNIVIEAGREKYKATFMSSCPGVRFTDSIGLSTMGPYELDRFTTVILPDGTRCAIKELVPYTAEMEQQDKAAKTK